MKTIDELISRHIGNPSKLLRIDIVNLLEEYKQELESDSIKEEVGTLLEEVWDKFCFNAGSDLFELEQVAGCDVMKEKDFKKAVTEIYKRAFLSNSEPNRKSVPVVIIENVSVQSLRVLFESYASACYKSPTGTIYGFSEQKLERIASEAIETCRQNARMLNSEPDPDAVRRNEDDSSNAAGPTPDSLRLKQARERLYWQQRCEAAEKCYDLLNMNQEHPEEHAIWRKLKSLQEEGK